MSGQLAKDLEGGPECGSAGDAGLESGLKSDVWRNAEWKPVHVADCAGKRVSMFQANLGRERHLGDGWCQKTRDHLE